MKVRSKIIGRTQKAVFALALLYMITVLFGVTSAHRFAGERPDQGKSVYSIYLKQNQKLFVTEAAVVNVSDAYTIWDKEYFVLPVLFFLSLLLFFSVPEYLSSPTHFIWCHRLSLFRNLPNAP